MVGRPPQEAAMNGDGWALGAVAALAVAAAWKGSSRGSAYRARKMRVPERLAETPRTQAEGRYVYPRERSFPIGDLFHARLAMIYALSPTHRHRAATIRAAVRQAWPDYDWDGWWREHGAKGSRA